jgi:capsular polysaccharide biosynthesis protein
MNQSEPSVDNDRVRIFVPRSAVPLLLVVTLTAAGAAAAAGYGLTAPKRYRATAQLLVSPVPASDTTFTGLPLLRDSGGKRTAAASAAAMLASPQVADAVRSQLGLSRSRDAVLAELHAHVVGVSDVVAVTAEDTSASGAAQLANAFADTLVSQRTASFQSQLATTISRDTQQLASLPQSSRATGAGAALQQRLATLHGYVGQADPTLKVTAQAAVPTVAYWPKLPRLVALGAGAGFAAGLVVALLLLLGRGRTAGEAPYDRPVSERFVKRLEQRADERIDALLAEQERLTAREAALAAREREVAARLDEGAAAPAGGGDEDELADRRAELSAQERELAAREARLAEREREPAEAPAPAATPGPEVEQRERELEARVAALGQRESELARRAAAVAAREREAAEQAEALERRTQELEGWAAELAAREAQPEREPEAQPEREPEAQPEPEPVAVVPAPVPVAVDEQPAQPVPAGNGRWNLFTLQRLVDEHGAEYPEHVEEWSSYLYFLREYAEPDGTVPASFDWLIEETFADLVA